MGALASEQDSIVLGYYQPFYLFASLAHSRGNLEAPPEQMKGVLGPEGLFRYALARYTFHHELRHFHDYFGTLAGVTLFQAHFLQLRTFAGFIEALRSTGKGLQLPFDRMTRDDGPSGEMARALVRNWRVFLQSTARFTEAFEKTTSFTHHPEDHVIYTKGDVQLPTFPLTTAIQQGTRVTPLTVYYPIGLEVLVEGNAQALQRDLMEAECSAELAARLVPSMHRATIRTDDPVERMRVNASPYNVTDFMVSKYLRLRGHPTFTRSTVTRLTDQALGSAAILPRSKPWEVPATFALTDVGRMFVEYLENSSLQSLVDGDPPYPDSVTRNYETLLGDLEKSVRPDQVEYGTDFIAPLNLIEAVVNHHIILPLIRARLETRHAVFYSNLEYLQHVPHLPEIPLLIEDGRPGYASYMAEKNVGDAWAKHALLTSAMHEIYGMKSAVRCFRAHEVPGQRLNLCIQGECGPNMTAGLCGQWPRDGALPDCLFSSLIKRFGLTA